MEWVKSEDRRRKEVAIDPTRVLELLGIDDYSISHEDKEVKLRNEKDFFKVANYFSMNVPKEPAPTAFTKHGWRWTRCA